MRTSVIIPVTERVDDLPARIIEYREALSQLDAEFWVVLDGQYPELRKSLEKTRAQGVKFSIIQLAKGFGESTALSVGFEQSNGEDILILPPYPQIDPSDLPNFMSSLAGNDMITGKRWPRSDSMFNRLQTLVFNKLTNFLTGFSFSDLGCGVRAMKRHVIEKIAIYGDQHRFLPLLVRNSGFKVEEIQLRQSPNDLKTRIYRPGVYVRRVLDVLSVFFLVKFTKKPLRFFGLVGGSIASLGAVGMLLLIAQRLFWQIPLGDRPALLLSSLIIVLGIQIFAIGLIGELIIFTHAKDVREYEIEEIIN